MTSKFNIDEVNFQLFVRLDTDQQGRSTASRDDFVGVVLRLEKKTKRSLQLLQNSLDECGERNILVVVRIVDIFSEDGDSLGIGLGLELVAALLENEAQLCAVGDDAVVNDNEVGFRVGADGVAIALGGGTVRSPSRMGDRDLGDECLVDIQVGGSDFLAQAGDFADFLEVRDGADLVCVNADACRVVASVFLASKTSTQDLEDLCATL